MPTEVISLRLASTSKVTLVKFRWCLQGPSNLRSEINEIKHRSPSIEIRLNRGVGEEPPYAKLVALISMATIVFSDFRRPGLIITDVYSFDTGPRCGDVRDLIREERREDNREREPSQICTRTGGPMMKERCTGTKILCVR